MKLTALLTQFFYSNRKLDIPGIGSFYLDSDVFPVSEPGKSTLLEGVRFEKNTGTTIAQDLIDYISSNTGKIKALASADLDCHFEQAKQFLNIGKPFLFDGIGTLTKLQNGAYQFFAGAVVTERITEHNDQPARNQTVSEEASADYKSILYLKKIKGTWKRPALFGLAIAGIALAVWGGYIINERRNSKKELIAAPQNLVLSVNDSVKPEPVKDSVAPEVTAGQYKFVVETAEKPRALKRYGFLKSNGLAIQMETADSVTFRLFFALNANPVDTTHILDSLRNFYTPPGKRAYVMN